MIDLTNLSPAPWEAETIQQCSERSAYEVVKDANGKVLFDSLNSDVAVIHEEPDEDHVHRWDEQGRVNLGFCALARNAEAVMMRRGWSPVKSRNGWRIDQDDGTYFCYGREDEAGVEPAEWPHPFVALDEADRWQTEQESKR